MRRPGYDVHRRRVQGEVRNFLPLRVLFAPDEYFTIVAGGREDVAVFWVSLVWAKIVRRFEAR